MSKDKDVFDTIDQYFSQINSEEISNKINKGINNFSKTIQDSLKNHGYNNFNEFIDGEIKDQKGSKPKFKKHKGNYYSRIEVVKVAIHQVNYGLKYRGYYQDGHSQALNDIDKVINQFAYDLDELADQIKFQIKEIKEQYKDYKKAYIIGYIDGLEYVQKAIIKSKAIMMERILNEIK